jgi:hypothetical protein
MKRDIWVRVEEGSRKPFQKAHSRAVVLKIFGNTRGKSRMTRLENLLQVTSIPLHSKIPSYEYRKTPIAYTSATEEDCDQIPHTVITHR